MSGCPVAGADRQECAGSTGHARAVRWTIRGSRTSTTRFWSAATVKSAVETLSPTRVKLTVEVTSEELQPRMDAAYKTIAQQVNIPGFRRGKVPNRIIDQRFGRGAVVQEAVNDALGEYYSQALAEHEVKPMGQPEVNMTELPLEDGQQLKFDAEVDVVPEFELPDFSTLNVEVDPVAVDEADVQTRLDNLLARFGTLVGVDRAAQDGDFTSVDISAILDGEQIDSAEGISYEIGSGTMLPGMDEALIGHTAGETVEFTAPLAGGDKAGQDAEITLVLQTVKERQLPEQDDEFAQLASEFDTFEELMEDLRAQSEQGAKFEQGVQARDKVLEQMLELVDIPVPDSVVEAEVHSHLENENRLEDDVHRAEVTESTQKAVKTQLLLDKLVERDEVQVEQNELVEYLVMAAQQYGMNPNEFAQQLDSQNQVPGMVAEVGRRKALASVLESVTVKDTDGNVVDLNEIETGDEDEAEAAGSVDSEDSVDSADSEDSVDSADSVDSVDSVDSPDEDEDATEVEPAEKA
nr:trigger factor [Ornithinimicrobium sp. HY1745]